MPAKKQPKMPISEAQQRRIEAMDIGDTISVSRRLDLSFGLSHQALQEHRQDVRASMDQQAIRARRRMRPNDYTVELVESLTRSGVLIITAACTRVL